LLIWKFHQRKTNFKQGTSIFVPIKKPTNPPPTEKREGKKERESYSDFGGFTRDGESNRHDSEKTHYSTHNLYPSLHFSFPLSPSFCSCEEVERVLTQNGNYGFLVSSLPILLIFLRDNFLFATSKLKI
jgi:hypothetical protein